MSDCGRPGGISGPELLPIVFWVFLIIVIVCIHM